MPSPYAHYRFGRELLPTLPADVRQCIQRFRRVFDVGLQGPDLFFYYNPLTATKIGALGGHFHAQSGQEFFSFAGTKADSEVARAYLYGLLGHYCLDSTCHPYIQSLVQIGEARHVALESEFDRYLLLRDGEPNPHTCDMSKHLKLTRGECMTVAEFYPPATGANISRSVKIMAFARKFLAHPQEEKRRKLLEKLQPGLSDHMIPGQDDPELALYVAELEELYRQAGEKYPRLLAQLQEHMASGTPLGEDFIPTFG